MQKLEFLRNQLKNIDNEPMEREVKDGKKPLTVEFVIIEALLSIYEEKMTEQRKYKNWDIVKKIKASTDGTVELITEEVAEIKKAVGLVWTPLVMGQVFDLIEGGNK